MRTHTGVWTLALVAMVLLLQAETTEGQVPDRSKPPTLGPPPALRLAAIQHMTLSNGLPVVFLEKHEVPLVQMNLVVNAGGAMDPAGKSGLASMTAAMMTEGAGARSALQLADAIDYLGARISVSAGQHTSAVSLHTPLAKLDSALSLMADITLRPTFSSQELERKRKERLTALVQWRDEPRSIASVIFNRTLYTDKHPYGVPAIGDETSLRSLTADDLKKFHDTYFHSNNATLIVVGDVTKASLLAKLESAFSGWKGGTVPATTLLPIRQVEGREVILVDKPGAAQSEIRIGRIGVPRLTDDYYAIDVMNTLLGGSFSSRLNQNLREQHGYSYGAGSRFDFRPLPGPFMAYASVQTTVTDKSLTEFMKELNGILQPVTDAELDRAKNYVALSFPGDFQSAAQIAGQLEQLVIYKLPDDYFNNYISRILAVTREDVQRVARKYIDPGKIAVIVVGDRKVIEPGIRALNLGPVKNLTVEDVLGKAPVVQAN